MPMGGYIRNPVNDCFCGHSALNHTATACALCQVANPGNLHAFAPPDPHSTTDTPQTLSVTP